MDFFKSGLITARLKSGGTTDLVRDAFMIILKQQAIYHKINAFEMWCYRRMLRISWTSHSHTTNIDVLQKIGVNETTMF